MTTPRIDATVHHLPGANPTLEDLARALTPGQWVRITWHNKDSNTRGTVEGTITRPSHLTNSLFVGHAFCLTVHGHLNIDVTSIETSKRPDLDIDQLAPLMEAWAAAMLDLEQKPVGRFKTGDNTAEANAVYDAELRVRSYLRGVRIR
jgi:hypothetical protein